MENKNKNKNPIVDLTKKDGCYSKELRVNYPKIKRMLNSPLVSVESMKSGILKIIEKAFINYKAKQRFIDNLHKCTSKHEINNLCHMSVICGMYYRPKKKEVV